MDAGLIDIGNAPHLNLFAKVSVTFLKRERSVFLRTAKEMRDGHQQIKATDSSDGANPAFVEREFLFGSAEKNLNAPSKRIEVENLPRREGTVR